jgi:fermentation-respiration switch protein FrsA (DUF1100 family)
LKPFLIITSLLLVLAAILFVLIPSLLAYRRVRWLTHVRRHPLWDHPRTYGLAYEDVSFPSRRDRLLLKGWFLPREGSDRCVVLVQGSDHHRNSPGIRALELGRDLVKEGFNVLLFDFRGRGESEGTIGGAGHTEQWDLEGALDWLESRGFRRERMVPIGFSLGAGVAIAVAARDPRIPAVVSDSGFLDASWDIPAAIAAPLNKLPWTPLAARFLGRLFLKVDLAALRPVEVVERIAPRPILFIHGEADDVVDVSETKELYRVASAANPNARLWLVPDTTHIRNYAEHPKEYVERVTEFLKEIVPKSLAER